MKFKIISTIGLLILLGLAYLIYQANQPDTNQAPPGDNGGIVLH